MDPLDTIAFLRAVVPVARELGVTRVSAGALTFDVVLTEADLSRLTPVAAESANQEQPEDNLTPPLLTTWGIKARRASE